MKRNPLCKKDKKHRPFLERKFEKRICRKGTRCLSGSQGQNARKFSTKATHRNTNKGSVCGSQVCPVQGKALLGQPFVPNFWNLADNPRSWTEMLCELI